MKLKRLGLGLMLCSSMILGACHNLKIEDNPNEKTKAVSVANKYLNAFFQGDIEKAMAMSNTPFWGDGHILETEPLLRKELEGQLKGNRKHPPGFTVESTAFFTLSQIKLLAPKVYKRLETKNFMPQNMFAVVISINMQGRSEKGLIFMQKQTDGMWKVVGIDD